MPLADPSRPAEANPAWVNWVVLAAVVGLVYLVFHVRPFGGPDSAAHPTVDRPLLVLALKGVAGADDVVTLREIEGQVVLLVFWGAWAPDSLELLSRIAPLAEQYPARKRFRLLTVVCGKPDARENYKQLKAEAERVREGFRLSVPVYVDPERATRRGLDALRASAGEPTRLAYPTTVLVDRKGFIRGVWEGYRPDFEEQIRRAVAEAVQP